MYLLHVHTILLNSNSFLFSKIHQLTAYFNFNKKVFIGVLIGQRNFEMPSCHLFYLLVNTSQRFKRSHFVLLMCGYPEIIQSKSLVSEGFVEWKPFKIINPRICCRFRGAATDWGSDVAARGLCGETVFMCVCVCVYVAWFLVGISTGLANHSKCNRKGN